LKKEHWSTLSHLKERLEVIKSRPGELRTTDIDLVYSFASKIASKEYLGGLVQAVVLFGSVSRDEATKGSDLDVLVVLDDISNEITSEMASAYSLTVGSLLAKLNAHDKIHLTTLGLIRFWDGVRNGEPVITSILRSGKAIVDTGFFTPLKAMLDKGMIKPTREAVVSHLRMAESLLRNTHLHYRRSASDLYWAVLDAAHALVMHAGEEPPHPKAIPGIFRKIAKKYKLSITLARTIELFLGIMADAKKGKIKKFTGKDVDTLRAKAKTFVNAVKKAIE
jgi:predicted nucleotidyltransferase/uncharacterized protein (UPF0332 family)